MDKITHIYDAVNRLEPMLRIQVLVTKKYLNVDEVSELFKIKKQTLYKLTYTHAIPYYKPNGKLIYFKRSDIELWIEKGWIKTVDEIRRSIDSKKGGSYGK